MATINGDAGNNTLSGVEGDTINGLGGNDTLSGGSLMFGGAGADKLTAPSTSIGPIFLDGGAGNDILNGNGNPNAVAFYYDSPVGVSVNLGLQGIQQNTVGQGLDTLNGIHAVVGSTHDDTLTGGAADELFAGGPGNDTIDGGGGFNLIDFSYDITGPVTLNLSITGPQNTGSWGTDTVSNIQAIGGSDFADTLTGDSQDNVILGKDGDDILNGGGGNDTISGAVGDDTIDGGAGDDILTGGSGVNTVSYADAPSYVLVNLLLQGSAQDTVGAGKDTLTGFQDITGSAFNDFLLGDSGNNVLEGGAGDDFLNGRGGSDTASYASAAAGVVVSLGTSAAQDTGGAGVDTLISIENLIGSAYNDSLIAGTAAASLQGGAGNDYLQSGAGADKLDGGSGNDAAGYGFATSAVTVNLGLTGVQHTGGGGNDTLTSIETVFGSVYNDTLTAASTGSTLLAGPGDDTMIGGAGNDTFDGIVGFDTVYYTAATAGVTVNLSLTSPQNTGGAGVDTLRNIDALFGSPLHDVLTAADSGSTLHGGGGNDWLYSGAGDDLLDGGPGAGDVAYYSNASAAVTVSLANTGAQNTVGAGTDTLTGIESLVGSDFKDDLTASSAGSTLFGGGSADVLHGGVGNDVLNGGGAGDILVGGGGQDNLTGGPGPDQFTFVSLTDSTNAAPDTITDFATAEHDRIDLSAIDANTGLAGDQGFHLGGGGGHAGDMVVIYDAGHGRTVLQLYVDNNASVDATVWMTGDHSTIAAADFIL